MVRFVVLSFLLHAWMVLLFGDANGGRRDGAGWARTFVATLESAVSMPIPTNGSTTGTRRVPTAPDAAPTPASTQDMSSAASSEPVPAASAAPQTAVEPVKPIEIQKIPAIAVEVPGANSPFSVAPISIAPIAPIVAPPNPAAAAAAPSALVAIATIGTVEPPVVKRDNTDFAIYVAPIVERAAVTTSTAIIPATPTLAPIPKPRIDREFAPYAPPPVVAVPPPVPVAATPAGVLIDTRTTSQDVLVPAPALPTSLGPIAEPAPPLKPIEARPIEPLRPAAANAQPESYRPREVEAAAATSAPKTPAKEVERVVAPSAERLDRAVPGTPAAALPQPSSGAGPSAIFNAPLPPPPAVAPPSSGAPRLDLDALRRQAREVTKEGAGPRTLMPFPTVAKEATKKDMEKIFDKALKRPDCKEAYSDLGLAAVVPLVRDAVKDGGCKW